jgi:hypothetical protein
MWKRTEERAAGRDDKGRPNFDQLLVARRAEQTMGDLILSHTATPGATKLRRNQFSSDNTCIVRDRKRPAGQIALHFSTPFLREERMLRLRLDAFSQNGNIQTPAEADQRANYRDGVPVGFKVGNKGPFDLYLVEGETVQI